MNEKKCLKCGKVLEKRIGSKRLNPKRKFCGKLCQTRFCARKNYHLKYKFNKEMVERQSEKIREWYKINNKRQKENVMRDYFKNKRKWVERKYVGQNRDKIIKLLILRYDGKCFLCGKKEIKVIHHETYDFPLRKTGRKSGERLMNYINWYCDFLRGFCSKACHMKYHKLKNIELNSDYTSL